ncbi:TetR/AcrR family transcriptional regulator [Cryobacterium sp. SO2]|uniref:TetR/AcrR family transcriptional regulator n=1 Tax=Cryobacterium sp. SO2 TaxID=1897060 RepID=UPI00223DABFA|nr:TetR/AcrR family transcriptional regulator [Cryobacterium sp. SO2]WEO78286.1 TetR/AcrR family transcriptional regulator [Cryobacterium sp. SO2]
MTTLRSDAARSRARILEVARTHDSHDLRLNDLAREAGVGVGTVYRHFPTVQALVEALTVNTIERMLEISQRAAAEPDPGTAFAFYLRSALTLQLEDGGLQSVLLSPADETDEVRAAKREIFGTFAAVLERAKRVGAVRPDLTLDQLSHLVCGIEYAVRLGSPADRSPLLEIILTGLRPAA